MGRNEGMQQVEEIFQRNPLALLQTMKATFSSFKKVSTCSAVMIIYPNRSV